ncbi:hypothetical protein B0T24DRAFT_584006 [Lasiosphaeria ovina]|uniref:RWD domain-containing protein n=1 Tax=Lasiosphaeria ovina TaxID=92902 RepID=A0AAE0JVT7_9PEZI|nr:hypothetical protein B0T24DRAFT_584006 [Lasiosphaeria ovina]
MAPPAFGRRLSDLPRGKSIKSAFDSESFDADGTIHVEGFVGSATISPSGRDVALASPEGLAIVDLDSPWSPPRRLSSHGLPWLVVDVQWSPFAARDYWVASTANHRCLVWNLNLRDDSSSGAVEHSLQSHTRAITDINFSAHHPDFLATCAVDGYVHCWDLRRPRRPALTFCDWFAGATQVKYNRQDRHILASSHDRWLHIWDNRRPVEPLKTISAHASKIYGVDWNRTRSTGIVTCSLDKSIKFWDYSKSDELPERVIRTDFPVWRARHTPFGWGLLAMPQTEPGNLYLYDRRAAPDRPVDGALDPVAVFPGHGNHKVKEFLWRSRGGVTGDGMDDREFQLVSWGEDNQLRLQKIEPKFLEATGYARGAPLRRNLNITRKGAAYKTFRTVKDSVNRDRRIPTMSDPRPGSGGQHRTSALSLGLRMRSRRMGPIWAATSMKAKTKSPKDMDKSQLQIGWMKGITMSKRKSGSDMHIQSGDDGDSHLFSPGYDVGWGEPESIQDELLRISSRFPNVKLENIDMDALSLNASLKGPWGVDRETIFIKVRVDIPSSYPKSKAPRFSVEKTSFMPGDVHKKIENELHELANRFLKKNQNCLDVAFTYLLGEVDLETSTASLFKNVLDLDDEIDPFVDDSSSDEDENWIPTGGSVSMSQELSASTELDPTASLAPAQRLHIPPRPRYCGARFSNDGRLICFFPTKEERETSALFALPQLDSLPEQPKEEPTFAGFGRLSDDAAPHKQSLMDENSATDDQSETSEDSDSTSSSDSEPTTVHKINLFYQPGRHFRKTWSASNSLRSSGAGTGAGTATGTGTGTGASQKKSARPRNILCIHDMQYLLPSKKEFAQEYAIFGDGAEVCTHNAAVAEKYGYTDLVHIWQYAAILLKRGIPLELHKQQYGRHSVLLIARDAVSHAGKEKKRGGKKPNRPTGLSGRVRWGYHPLAQDLISDLFAYFESLADIQMLAMLSCIFGGSSTHESVFLADPRNPQPRTPLPMKAPSFSVEYFPTDPELWNTQCRSQASSAITTPRTAHTPVLYSESQNSDDFSGLAEFGPSSYSRSDTPPRLGRDHFREVDHTQSLSTSPNTRFFHRSNSTMAAALAASLPRALAGIVSGSPPEPPRKRPSPVETILSNLTPSSITWGAPAVFGGRATETPGTARTSISDDEFRRDELLPLVPVAVSCVSENQAIFDDDGWVTKPLLDHNHGVLYTQYRYAYAELLQIWRLPLSRLEIMKFNAFKDPKLSGTAPFSSDDDDDVYHESRSVPRAPANSRQSYGTTPRNMSPTMPLGRRRALLRNAATSGRGLDILGLCRIHETPLDPIERLRPSPKLEFGGAVGICNRCHPFSRVPQTHMRCVYCLGLIDGLYSACLSCGCATHPACLSEWHAMGELECPAGDECNCAEEASSGHVESWPALQAAMAMRRKRASGLARLAKRIAAGNISSRLATNAPLDTERLRRRSVPSDLAKAAALITARSAAKSRDNENTTGSGSGKRVARRADDDYGGRVDRQDWGRASASHGGAIPSTVLREEASTTGKPPPHGDEPVSAARLSLGNRLKRTLGGDSGRPSTPRRKSGGVTMWKS